MKRNVFLFGIIVFLLLNAIGFSAVADTSQSLIFDNIDLFTEGEIEAMEALARQVSESESCTFYVATYPNIYSEKEIDKYGEHFLNEQGLSEEDDIVLLILRVLRGEYRYNMFHYGDVPNHISEKEVNYILDHDDVFDNIKSGDFEKGVSAFLTLAAKAYSGRVGVSYVIIAIVSFAIALTVGIVACVSVKATYSMKQKSVDYPLNRFAKLELREHSDVFMGSFITKRVIDTGSGHGGRGGSRGGGGRGHAGGR